MDLGHVVVALLEELGRISLEHDELTDTDVREAIHLTLNRYFVWGHERSRFPRTFEMFSQRGDELVGNAIRHFLESAETSGELSSIPIGQARLDLLQASSAKTADGRRYDEFYGHRDTPLPPKPLFDHMFEDGDYADEEE